MIFFLDNERKHHHLGGRAKSIAPGGMGAAAGGSSTGQGVGVAGVGAANNNSNNTIAEKPNIPSISTTPRSTTIRIQGSTRATFFSAISKSISNSTSISGRKIYPKKLVIENVPEELNELDERPITPGPPSAPPPDENNLRNVIINRDHNLFLDHMEV